MYFVIILVIVVSCVSYQLLQKAVPSGVNPVVSLIVTYAAALVLSCGLFFVFPLKKGLIESFREVNYVSVLVGLSIIGIELGYLLIYRFGGKVSFAYALVSAAVIASLALAGFLWYREEASLQKILGIAFCVAGVFLLTLQKD